MNLQKPRTKSHSVSLVPVHSELSGFEQGVSVWPLTYTCVAPEHSSVREQVPIMLQLVLVLQLPPAFAGDLELHLFAQSLFYSNFTG